MFGLTEINYALKRIYPKYPPEKIGIWKHKFLANTTKDDSWVGEENFKQGVEYGNPQGIGGNFAKAQAAALVSSTMGAFFDVPRRWKNGIAIISGRAIVATGNNEGAFFKAVKRETDNGIRAYNDRLSVEAINGDGNGWIARVQGIAGSVVTLGTVATGVQRWMTTRIKEGMTLNSSTTGLLGGITAFNARVLKVNYGTGKITLDGVVALSADDYLAPAGDFEEGGLHGVNSWIPLADPADGVTYFGVDRAINYALLSGHRLPATEASNSIKDNALNLAAEMETTGSLDDTGEKDGYLHPLNWNRLQKDLDAQIKRDVRDGTFGFNYFTQESAAGTIKWYSEPDWPADRGHILTRSAWVIRHAQGFPHLNDDDGNSALRSPTADSVEVRLRSAGNLFCLAPGANGVFPITPPA